MIRRLNGKLAPRIDARTIVFGNYISDALPAPDPAHDAITMAMSIVGESNVSTMFPMDDNDTLGDCTICACAHAATLFAALVGEYNVVERSDVVTAYTALSGGKDTGLDELTVLNWWKKNDVGGVPILAYAAVDPKNIDHVKLAIQLLGAVYVGMNVPANMEQCFELGEDMDVGPLTGDGHAVLAAAYDETTVEILTWGGTLKMTWACWEACVDEAYAILPTEAQHPGYSKGLDFAQLQTDLSAISTGTV